MILKPINNVSTNGITKTIAIPIKNDTQFSGTMEKKAGKPPMPIDVAFTPLIVIKTPAIAEPISAEINGYLYLKLTPNIAGSVIPNHAEIDEVTA